ncbi:hypothetical protein SORBI_3003G122300 [Sorghum bicolor]|uniref:Uncharacterized protein n=1 Tax=Sorghum bicolor TaxID=4558 RepID=A0A1W0VWZ9_SORBI|nr:hypothetical protein SORBI_3003G122300 [Sorghum bicolor]
MSRRRGETCDSWRPPRKNHAGAPPLLRAGPRIPAFASLSVREGGDAAAAVAKAVEEVVVVQADEVKEQRAALVAVEERAKTKSTERRLPPAAQLVHHPLALLALVPNSAALFAAGAAAGTIAKTVTAPLDRVKILMQTHSVRVAGESAKKGVGFLEAMADIGKKDGLKGYWKGNLPQVIRIIPYSAVQLFSYEVYKKIFRTKDGELSVFGRLAAGACAGMTSTLVTYPLDVLRLRLAVQSGHSTLPQALWSVMV